jgi:uncharacterized Zn finger protein (UPF0148 family)
MSAPTIYPTSNVVRVITGHVLTLEDFNNCERCASGLHSEDGATSWCPCCQMPDHLKEGDTIPFTRP